jgi:hypothetical protein
MPKRPELIPPPPVPRKGQKPEPGDSDEWDPSADIDAWDPVPTDDFDDRDWPDDPPCPLDAPMDDAPEVSEEVDEAFIDDVPDDLPLDNDDFGLPAIDEPPDEDLWDEPIVVPWKTTGWLPEHDLTLPVVLEVTEAHSCWVGGPGGQTRVILEGLALEVELIGVEGSPQQIRLGRNAISNRVLVKP